MYTCICFRLTLKTEQEGRWGRETTVCSDSSAQMWSWIGFNSGETNFGRKVGVREKKQEKFKVCFMSKDFIDSWNTYLYYLH